MTTPPTRTARADGYCCDEYAAMRASRAAACSAAQLALAGATTMVGGAVVTASPARAASASSVLVVRLAARRRRRALARRPARRPGLLRRPAGDRDPAGCAAGQGRHSSGCTRPWPASCRCGRRASSRRCTPPGCRSPTAPTSRPWRRWRTPTPARATRVGWLNRLVSGTPGTSPLQGFSAGTSTIPTSLVGPAADDVRRPGRRRRAPRQRRRRPPPEVAARSCGTARSRRSAAACGPRSRPSARSGRPRPPRTTAAPTRAPSLGQSLATAAQIIRGDVGVEVITVDQGDWDMHTDMGSAGGGWMWNNAEDLAQAIAAFFADLGTQRSKVTLVTLSEFGRRVEENDSNGTDHGYGNVMFVAGAGVRGGYHGRLAGAGQQLRRRPHGHHRLPPGARRHRLEALQRLGGEGVPRAEVAVHGRHALTLRTRPDLPGCLPTFSSFLN